MQGAKDLIESERGVFCLLVLAAATVLAVVGTITGQSWLDFVKWLTITLVASKTATGAIETITGKTAPPASTSS